MPELNGVETVRRARDSRRDLKIFFMTGYADLTADERMGSAPVLRKPFLLTDLWHAIGAVLAGIRSLPPETLSPVIPRIEAATEEGR